MTRLGGVPISVIIPPMLLAKAKGISSLEADAPLTAVILTTMGSIRATVPVLLTNAPIRAVPPITSRKSLEGELPASLSNRALSILARPVLKMAPPTTKRPIIIITIELENPDNASPVVSTPPRASTLSAIRATRSALNFPHTKKIAAKANVARVSVKFLRFCFIIML